MEIHVKETVEYLLQIRWSFSSKSAGTDNKRNELIVKYFISAFVKTLHWNKNNRSLQVLTKQKIYV